MRHIAHTKKINITVSHKLVQEVHICAQARWLKHMLSRWVRWESACVLLVTSEWVEGGREGKGRGERGEGEERQWCD